MANCPWRPDWFHDNRRQYGVTSPSGIRTTKPHRENNSRGHVGNRGGRRDRLLTSSHPPGPGAFGRAGRAPTDERTTKPRHSRRKSFRRSFCHPSDGGVVICFTPALIPWYSKSMVESYVGIIGKRGVESFLPENQHTLHFLMRRAYRSRPMRAVCYWAALRDTDARSIEEQLDADNGHEALRMLEYCATHFGTIPPAAFAERPAGRSDHSPVRQEA